MIEDLAPYRDPNVTSRRRLVVLGASLAALAGCLVLSRFPAAVETPYATVVCPALTRALAAASGIVPVSLFELALGAMLLSGLVRSGRVVVRVARGRRGAGNALGAGLFDLTVAASVLLAVFFALFGLNHARPEVGFRLGWTDPGSGPRPAEAPPDPAELAALGEELVLAANESYRAATGSDDAGAPSAPPGGLDAVDASLERAYAVLATRLGFEPAFGTPRARAKPVLASALLARLGIGGFYSPWTGEANYNRIAPGCTLPHTIAHEKAHQRGIAAEDEANFVGFLSAKASDHPYARYSAYLFAQEQLLRHLDAARARSLVALRTPGVARDLEARLSYFRTYHGRMGDLGRAVNDAYLKVAGASLNAPSARAGVRSYGKSVRWLVAYARRNGGRCVADASR